MVSAKGTIRATRSTDWLVYNYYHGSPSIQRWMLLTKENRNQLPPLYSQENEPDPIARVKFFTPWTNWTWYATEFDGVDTFFGLVDGHEKELGYFNLSELESVKGMFGLRIERDRHFPPTRLSELS